MLKDLTIAALFMAIGLATGCSLTAEVKRTGPAPMPAVTNHPTIYEGSSTIRSAEWRASRGNSGR